jgi:hypothetical protein
LLIGITALVAVCAIAAGVAVAASSSGAGTRGVILFVGDSTLSISTVAIESALADGTHRKNSYVPVIAARPGGGIRTADCSNDGLCNTFNYWKIKLGGLLTKVNPDAIVSSLGIDDAALDGSATGPGTVNYAAKIDWFMNLIPKTKPVYWTNLPCDVEPQQLQARCRTINWALSYARGRWPNLQVLDFASAARGHPEYMNGRDAHPSWAGQLVWSNMIVDALDTAFPNS